MMGQTKNIVVVYVDDDADDHLIMSEAFAAFPETNFHSFLSGKALFDFLSVNTQAIALFLLDINMPVQNGVEIAKQLRFSDDYKGTLIRMLSTGQNSPQADELRSMGIKVFQKQYELSDVKAQLKAMLKDVPK